ncbi:MAG: hypothetical protein M2R45_05411 [Verrucomicrobia subdivision 3 bacterium]|nr:hypothetical protein [Limisphaerales bacterium]
MILNDDSSKPDIFNSPLATLTGPDPRGRRDYDFVPPAGTTIFLEPETTYWLVYTSAGLPSNFNYYRTRSRTDMSQAGLRGWDIGNDLWFWDSNDGAWERLRTGTRGEIRLPMKFGVEATPVPEPSEYALFFALGLGAFVFWHRRCQREQRTAA